MEKMWVFHNLFFLFNEPIHMGIKRTWISTHLMWKFDIQNSYSREITREEDKHETRWMEDEQRGERAHVYYFLFLFIYIKKSQRGESESESESIHNQSHGLWCWSSNLLKSICGGSRYITRWNLIIPKLIFSDFTMQHSRNQIFWVNYSVWVVRSYY